MPMSLASDMAFWFAFEWSCSSVFPNDLTPSLLPFCCASLPISTSARLPSMAFLRKAWPPVFWFCAHAAGAAHTSAATRPALTNSFFIMVDLARKDASRIGHHGERCPADRGIKKRNGNSARQVPREPHGSPDRDGTVADGRN